ncbi:MAG: glycosyltransferase family 2 protein [Verrucomicrobia bacterium]|nr:glycosyltransferase family 2 protein [Verrucomicrobiota bacterium]
MLIRFDPLMTSSEEMNTPTVSILIAVYNSEPYLGRTLDSILAQTLKDFRCILSDDCSMDRSLEICERYSESDPRFRILRNSENLGWIGNVNRLLDQVDNEFFMIMPHDDVLAPLYLERLVEALKTNPEAIVSFSDVEYFYADGTRSLMAYNMLTDIGSAKKRSITMLRKGEHWWIPYRGILRSELAKNEFRLLPTLAGNAIADLPWVLDLAMRGEFVRHPEFLYTKHVYKEGVSSLWTYSRWEHIASLLSCMRVVTEGPLSFIDKCHLVVLLQLKVVSQIWYGIKQTFQESDSRSVQGRNQ